MECSAKGGTTSGSCAMGFGVCCVFIFISSSMQGKVNVRHKVSYLQTPNYPQAQTTAFIQTVQVEPYNDNVCQIRLDFMDFQSDGGSAVDMPCDTDMFEVSGVGGKDLGIGVLCGMNTYQNLYIHLNGTIGGFPTIKTTRRSSSRNARPYMWNVKITQVS